MTETAPILLVELLPDDTAGRLTVGLEAYLNLGDEITLGVDQLVQRWQHQSAPAAIIQDLRQQRAELSDDLA